jgi:hypothetical protein
VDGISEHGSGVCWITWDRIMCYDVNQHLNSKSRTDDKDVSYFTQITQLKFE